jgi:radical SAM protein with 4Fe4S-binding SPASM domain
LPLANPVIETPPKITIGITETCPLRCHYCYADCAANPKPGELSAAQWIGLIGSLAEQGVIQVYFEGGEPLAKPGFLDILRAATPVMMTLLRTHGIGLTADVAAELAAIGLGRGLVDLMGADAATHDAATGTPGSFDQSCAAVRNLVGAGIPADVLVILTVPTAPQLTDIAELAASLGASRIGVLRLYPLGRARAAWKDLALSLKAQTAAIAALRLPKGLGLMQSWHPNNHNCCWQAAAINASGRAIGCMYLRDYVDFGDATQVPYNDIFRDNPLYKALRSGDVEETCGDCSTTQGSHGGCRSAAYAFHGRWTAPDPFDTSLNRGTDLTRLPPERPRPLSQEVPVDATMDR